MSTRDNLQNLTVKALRDLCEVNDLPSSGKKVVLIQRLLDCEERNALYRSAIDNEEDLVRSTPGQRKKKPLDRDDMESSDEEEIPRSTYRFTFNDIGDSLEKFSGENTDRGIDEWLVDFEKSCDNFGWNDVRKFVYGRRLLKGTAKLFVQSSSGLNDWESLKNALKNEFEDKVSSAEIHELLRNRKKKSDETILQYIYHLKNIAKRGNIEEEALCEYVARGVSDDPVNKMCLYGARTLAELKERVKQYEKVKSQLRDAAKGTSTRTGAKSEREKKSVPKRETSTDKCDDVRCYNCGGRGHYANDCEKKSSGPKCFVCSEFGHRAKDCKKNKKAEPDVNTITEERMPIVEIRVAQAKLRALFDTGSRYNVMCESVYQKIGGPQIVVSSMTFSGFGAAKTRARGTIAVDVDIGSGEYVNMTFYVVPPGCMSYDAILGMEALDHLDVEVNRKGVVIKRKKEEIESDECDLLMVLEGEKNCIAIDVAPKYAAEVNAAITSYKPNCHVKSRVQTKIILTDDVPVNITPRRFAPKEKQILEKTIEEWLKAGIIKESASEYASPVTLAPKKNGSMRVCVDYRQLNRKILKDCFPMRNIEDQIDSLKSSKVFTVLDLKNSFFHVPVEKSSQKYTSFVTHMGQYEFVMTPFGLSVSPASFSRFVADVFRDQIKRGIMKIYVDDVIIPSSTAEENLELLKEILVVAAENGIQFNWEKSQFLKDEVEYLGYVISNGGYKVSPAKIKAVSNYKEPCNAKELQRFLGLTSYFRKFIPGYALTARPLTSLLKKDSRFDFGETQRRSFEQLKERLVSDPVLKIYDPKAVTEVHTDASKEGYGAVLLQKGDDDRFHPIYYMSKQTTSGEKNYSAYLLEVLAVVRAVERFRVYLLGIPFKIVTDCVAFKHTVKAKKLNATVAKWVIALDEYQYQVDHRAGDRMKHVDALSRAPVMMTVGDPLVEMIKNAQRRDERLQAILELVKTKEFDDYFVSGDILMKIVDGREVTAVPAELQTEIIRQAHENGHFGVRKLEQIIKRDYHIPQLTAKIKRQIECCVKCILAERKRGKTEGLLSPIAKGEVPFDTYHVDHLGPMDATEKQYKYLYVVVDAFTKYVWIYPTKTTNAQEVIHRMQLQSELFGNPRRIISDRGAAFTSSDFKEYCALQNIEQIEITTGVPRGNGQVERVNQVILAMLTKLSVEDKTKWYKHVGNIQRWINSSFHQSTSVSPFESMFGVQMRHEGDIRLGELLDEIKLAQFDDQRRDIRARARESIEKAQEGQRRSYNLRAKQAPSYKEGDVVAIKRTQFGPGKKYAAEYLGPYKITKVKGNDRYDVEKVSGEGPRKTTTAASNMKQYRVWSPEPSQDDRVVRDSDTDDN